MSSQKTVYILSEACVAGWTPGGIWVRGWTLGEIVDHITINEFRVAKHRIMAANSKRIHRTTHCISTYMALRTAPRLADTRKNSMWSGEQKNILRADDGREHYQSALSIIVVVYTLPAQVTPIRRLHDPHLLVKHAAALYCSFYRPSIPALEKTRQDGKRYPPAIPDATSIHVLATDFGGGDLEGSPPSRGSLKGSLLKTAPREVD